MYTTVVFREAFTKRSFLDTFVLPGELIPDRHSFEEMWSLHPEEHSTVVMYGKEIPVPRWQQSYLRDYAFSGNVNKALPLPDQFKPYLDWLNDMDYGEFNEVLINFYQDGNHYIGSHADDESELIPDSPIVTITLCSKGLPRKFRIREKKTKKIIRDIETTNGLVLIMGGKFQKEFKHEVVKMTGGMAEKAGKRISITLRQFK